LQLANEIEPVLLAYATDCRPNTVEALGGAGGFSGAQIWRVTAPRGQLCLRRWPPEHPSQGRLQWIHRVLGHVSSRGFELLPLPIATATGRTFHEYDGCLWELTHWMPGEANYWREPHLEKLRAAMTALAVLHRAAEDFPDTVRSITARRPTSPSPPSGIAERLAIARRLLNGGITELRRAVAGHRHEFPALADQANELFVNVVSRLPALETTLEEASQVAVPVQPCLRDIWHDHVLFLGNHVSGIVDVGSMRVESVAADVSRLLGSLCGNDEQGWTTGLDAYAAVRPLTAGENTLLRAFDQSQILLSGINWVEWVFVERRRFSDPEAVLRRMEHILSRLSG
jgi:homoserine kinase type II